MSDALLRFIVAGDIPGTHTQLGYKSSIAFAGMVIFSTVFYLTLSQRRRVTRILRAYSPLNIELITL
jgi:hypothetical protein